MQTIKFQVENPLLLISHLVIRTVHNAEHFVIFSDGFFYAEISLAGLTKKNRQKTCFFF